MTAAANLLNAIAQETGSTDKNQCIGIAMQMLVKSGLTVDAAMDTLFGQGAYAKFAGQVYDQLRAA